MNGKNESSKPKDRLCSVAFNVRQWLVCIFVPIYPHIVFDKRVDKCECIAEIFLLKII